MMKNNIIRARISTLDVRSFVPAWTTLAADCAAEAATRDKRPNPCESKQNSNAYIFQWNSKHNACKFD